MARFMLTRVDKTPREEEKPIVARNRGLEKREKDKIRRERERERERSQQESNNMRQSKSTMEAAVAQQVKQQSKYQQMQQQQAQQQQQQQQHNWHKYLWAGHFGGPGAQQQGQTGQSPDSQSQQQQQAQQWHHLQQYYNVPHHLWGMYNYHHPQQQQQYQQQQQQAQQQQAQSPTAQQQSGSKSSGSKTSTEQQQSSPGPSQAQTQQQQQQTQQQQQQTVQQYAPGPMMPHFYHPHFYNHNFMHPYLLHNWYNQHHQQQQQAQQQQQMQQQQQQQVQQSMQLSDNRGQGGVTGQSVNFKLPGEQDINSSQKPLMRKTKSNKSQGSTQNSDKSFKSGSDKQSSQQGTKDKDLDPDNDDDDDDMNDVDKINDDSDGMDNSDEYDGEDLDDDNITASSAMFDDEGMNKNGSLGMQTVDPKHLLTDIFDLKDKEPMCRKDQLLERLALEHLMVTKFWNFALYIVDFILWILLLFWIYPTNNLFPLYQLIADVYKFDDHLPDIQDINGVAEYLHFAATEASPQLTLGSDEYIKDPLVKYYISDLEELQAVETGEQHYIDENDAPVGGEFINGRDITVLAWIWGEPQSESMNLIKKLDRKTGTVCWQIGSHNATLRGNWTWGYWDYNQKRQAIKDAKRADQHVLDGIGLKITTIVQTQQTNSLNGNTNSDQNGTQNDNQQQSQPIITQTSTETIPSQTQNYFNNTQLYYNWSNPKPQTDPIIIINPNAPNDEIYSKQWILVSVAIKVETIKVENDESKKKTKIGFLYGSQQKEYSWIDAPSETENGGMDDCEKGHVYVGGGGGHVAHVRWLPGILSNSEILYLQKHGRLPWDVLSARNPITHQNAQSYREMDSLPHSESTSNSKTSKSKIAVEVQKLPIKAVQLAPPVLVQTRAKAVQCDDIVEVKDLVPIFTTQWLYRQVERFCSDYSDIGRYICQWPFDGEKGLSQNYNSKYTNPTQLNAKNDDSEFQSEIDHTTTLNSNLLCADPNLLEQSEELLGSKPTSKPFMGIDHAYVEFLDLFSTHHIMRNSEVMESAGFVDFQTKELRLVVPIWSPGLNAVCQLIILFKQDIHSGHIVSTPKLRIVHQLSNYDNLIFFLLMSILLVCMVLEIYMIGIYRPKKIDRERESWLELIKKDSEMGKKLMENIQTSTIITEGVGDYLPYYSHIDFFDLYFRSFSFSIIFFTLLFYWSNDRDDIQSQRFLKVIEDLSTGIEWDSNDVANQILPTFGESLSEINQNLDIQDYVARLYILIGFVMIYRVVVFLRIQPRCAILFKTIQLAVDDLFHFILVFSFIFFCFATLSHWIFGAKHEDFRTVSLAANTQFMMLVGEFPWTEQVDFFYALYLIIFTVIVFLIMLSFFLAIVVDAYAKTKEYVTICTVELNVLFDIHCIINHYFQSRSNGWPSRMAMLVALLHIDDDDCYNVGIGESEPQMSGSSDRRSMKRGSSTVDGGMSSDEQMTPKGLDGNKKSLRLNSSDTDDLFLNENLNDDNIGNPEDSRESGVSSYGGGPGDSINSLKNSKPGSQPSSVTKTKSDDSKRSRISTNSSDLGESKFVQNIKRGNALTSQNVVSFNIDQSISRSSDLNYGSQSESQALYNDINRSTNFDEADDNYSGMNDSYNNFNDESGYNSDSDTNKQQNQQQSQSSSLNQIDPGPIITKKTCLKLRAFSPTKQLFKSMRSARKYLKFYNEHIPAISFEFSKGDDHDAINLSSNDDELLEHNNLLLRLRHLDRIRYQMAQISQRLECMQKGQAYRPQKNPNKFENLMRQSYRPGVNVPGLAAMGGLNAQIAGSIGTAATSLAQMGGDQLNKLSGIKSGQLGGPLGQQQGLGTAASGPQSSMNLANAIHSISLMQKSAQLWQASTTLGQGKTGLGGDVNNPDPRSSNSMMSMTMTGFNTRLNQQQQQNQSDPFAGFTVPGPPPMPHPSMFYGLSPFGPGPPAMFPPSPTNNNTTTMSMNPMNPGPDSGTGSTSWKLLSRSRDKLLNKSNLNTREEGSAADGGSRVLKSSELNEDEDIEPNRA